MEINNRLRQIMDYFQLSPTQFADKLSIQRSAISHLLSGRNKPSILILEKIITNFPEINIEWLISGNGNFLKEKDNNKLGLEFLEEKIHQDSEKEGNKKIFSDSVNNDPLAESNKDKLNVEKNISVEKIILIFGDKTFELLHSKNQ